MVGLTMLAVVVIAAAIYLSSGPIKKYFVLVVFILGLILAIQTVGCPSVFDRMRERQEYRQERRHERRENRDWFKRWTKPQELKDSLQNFG